MYTDQVKHVTANIQQMFTSFHRVTAQYCGRSETKPVIDAQLSAPHDILEMIFLTIELSYQIMRGRFPSPISYTPKLNVDDVQFQKKFIFEKTFLNPYVDNAINNLNNVQLYILLYVNCTSLWRKITMIFEERHKEFAVKCFARFMTISAIEIYNYLHTIVAQTFSLRTLLHKLAVCPTAQSISLGLTYQKCE